jgi:hypothetical protein
MFNLFDKYFPRKSSTLAFINSIFFNQFNFAFSFQSLLADFSLSTEITFLAQYLAKIIQIVQVQE